MNVAYLCAAAVLLAADEKPVSVALDGHTLSIQHVDATMTRAGSGQELKIEFAAEPKDATKSFAYEVGQRFVAKDAEGKDIPVGMVQSMGRSRAVFRLSGYPKETAGRISPFGDALTIRLPLLKSNVATIASLEGDLFVSDVELLEFTFARKELNPNVVKTAGGGEAKLYLFDEQERGVEVGFKLRLPLRSQAESLGGRNFGMEQILLFAREGGRKTALPSRGMSGSGNGSMQGSTDFRSRYACDFHLASLSPSLESLHLVIPQIEYPRRLKFELKNVPVPAPAAMPPGRPPVRTKAKGVV